MKAILSFCLTLVLVLAGAPAQASGDDLVIYDDFAGNKIDPDKWEPRFIEAEALDVMRRVGGGRLRLRNTTYGNDTTFTGGKNSTRVKLRFPDAVAANITEIKAKVELRRVELIGCAAPGTDTISQVRTRTGRTFFNDGTGGLGDATGDVFAQIQLLRRSDTTDAPNVMRVQAVVDRCNDPNCNIDLNIFFDNTALGTVAAKHGKGKKGKAIIGVRWDPDHDRFIFRRDGTELIFDYATVLGGGPIAEQPPGFEFADVEVRARIENCDIINFPQDRPVGHLKVFWDFLKVNPEAVMPWKHRRLYGSQ